MDEFYSAVWYEEYISLFSECMTLVKKTEYLIRVPHYFAPAQTLTMLDK